MEWSMWSNGTLMWFWFGLALLLLVIELVTVGLTTIWFCLGALFAGVTAALGGGLPLQLAVFLIVSVVLFLFTRPLAIRYLNTDRVRTNYEREIGKIVILTEDVDNLRQTGRAQLDGKEWTVRAADDAQCFKKGEHVVVKGISGVKLLVERR